LEEAKRLGMVQMAEQTTSDPNDHDGTPKSPADMTKDVYDVPFLQNATVTNALVQYSQALIQHSKETFWVDQKWVDTTGKALCPLENLAWSIYQHHCDRYGIASDTNGGAEWWVQVKQTNESSYLARGIDLHYDKDEALAESFGLGSFPTLSTVTYLTAATQQSPPTVVLDHLYTQGEEEVMSELLISRPRVGKHLVFDGRLLHGAPYHPKLQPAESDHEDNTSSVRVTFLVNIWKDRRPANVEVLNDEIRQYILDVETEATDELSNIPKLKMDALIIPTMELSNENQLPEEFQQRIELPFVSDKAVMSSDEESTGLVVVTFASPTTEDNLLVRFGPGMQAYLEYLQNEDADNGTNAQKLDWNEEHMQQQQSDYV
jgi:hypothetical protein